MYVSFRLAVQFIIRPYTDRIIYSGLFILKIYIYKIKETGTSDKRAAHLQGRIGPDVWLWSKRIRNHSR